MVKLHDFKIPEFRFFKDSNLVELVDTEIKHAQVVLNGPDEDWCPVFDNFEGPVWFETTDDNQGRKIIKICDVASSVTKNVVENKLKKMGIEGDFTYLVEPKVMSGETIMVLKIKT